MFSIAVVVGVFDRNVRRPEFKAAAGGGMSYSQECIFSKQGGTCASFVTLPGMRDTRTPSLVALDRRFDFRLPAMPCRVSTEPRKPDDHAQRVCVLI